MKRMKKTASIVLALLLILFQLSGLQYNVADKHFQNNSIVEAAGTYSWNNTIPEKTPAAGTGNGKLVLFDNSHGETSGAADWVLDGGFSDFADALVSQGYTVREYRGIDKNGDGAIRYYDDRQTTYQTTNEAVITYDAIQNADVFVIAEANRPFTQSEYAALKQFVDAGKGIYFVADHYNADRNMNTWDCTEVYNGYNRSTDAQYNMGGLYGDMRNPGSATAGWLSQNFGLRFRFNAIDYKSGLTGVKPAADTEGITQGVQPVLMAAGSTLAITDPNKAKGLVYFGSTDTPVKWTSAADQGLYFGGEAEGPFVAISKPSAGKAAFIGDSSPLEDATSKYKREDSGAAKTTYAGWTSAGNAATLSVNIVNWLANSESYVGFDGVNHTKGIATPTPMASIETSQSQAEPWATPSYNPWDTDTFAYGSYGASDGSTTGGGGTTGNVTLSFYPSYVYVNEPFAISLGGSATNPEFGAYTTGGTQVGQVYLSGSWTTSGYNAIPGTTPMAATVRVTAYDSTMNLKVRTSSTVYDKKTATGMSSGYGYLQGTVNGQQGEIVAALQGGVIVGTAQIDSSSSVKIAAKAGSGTTLALYGVNGVKKSDLSGTYTVTSGQTTQIASTTVPVTGVTLNKASTSLVVGTTETLTATVAPANATNQSVTWSSSNTAAATISSSGVVTAVAPGTATITVTTADGSKTASCTVTVTSVAVTGVTLNKTSTALTVGSTETLTATVAPTNATNKNVTWSSSNTAAATVSSSGVVTAVAPGTATITVTTADGSKTATCTVTVTSVAVTGVTLNKTSTTIAAGSTETLTATIAPTNATNKNVTWSSSNTSVATVSSSGVVTAVAAGTAVITVTTADGGKTATCTVTVNSFAAGSVYLALSPAYVYVNQPFAIAVTGNTTNPEFGAYNSSGTQLGQLYLNGAWTSSGYNAIPGTTPVAATARVTTYYSSLTLKIRTASTYEKKTVTCMNTGYGFLQGTVSGGQQGDIVAAVQNGVIIGTAQIDANGQVKIAAKAGSGITLKIYDKSGVKKADLTGSYTVTSGATTTI